MTINPSTLTADTIPRTVGTPNFSFKIGRRKTPNVAPSFATPAANPPAVPRNCVGNNIGANVKVVELGPAFMSRLNRMNPANTNGMCKLEFVRPTAPNRINIPAAMPAKPMICMRIRPNRGTIQTPSRKPTSKNKSISSRSVGQRTDRSAGSNDYHIREHQLFSAKMICHRATNSCSDNGTKHKARANEADHVGLNMEFSDDDRHCHAENKNDVTVEQRSSG